MSYNSRDRKATWKSSVQNRCKTKFNLLLSKEKEQVTDDTEKAEVFSASEKKVCCDEILSESNAKETGGSCQKQKNRLKNIKINRCLHGTGAWWNSP